MEEYLNVPFIILLIAGIIYSWRQITKKDL